jgi:hypothetical protein
MDLVAWLRGLGLEQYEQAFRENDIDPLRGSALSPLVGRQEEIDLLLRRWPRAKMGDGQVVLISGEPGIGKSRIGSWLTRRRLAADLRRVDRNAAVGSQW